MTQVGRRSCIAALCGSALGYSASARAEPAAHPQVALEVDPCVAVAVDEVRAIVGVELGALLVPEGVAPTRDVTAVRVGCGAAATDLRVDDPITGKSLTRSVNLSVEAAKARPRLLALSIVELVSASWTELEANPTPALKPVGAVASPGARDAARTVVRARAPTLDVAPASFRLEALVGRRVFFPNAGGALDGLGLRVGGDRLATWRALGWTADMLAEHGASKVALGAVNVDLVSASFALLAHHETSSIALRAGVGARFGSARVSGNPADSSRVDASSVAGAWGGPFVVAGVGLAALRPVVIELTAEGGWCVVPVRGHVGEARDVGPIGPWVGVTLGVGVQP